MIFIDMPNLHPLHMSADSANITFNYGNKQHISKDLLQKIYILQQVLIFLCRFAISLGALQTMR